ncbi:serine/threonine-protein kinase [Gordonia sp. VNK1]|uniref:serine/threonine protein kinase n=1 Tax=Gordonia oleivorans TaxID=3156618 RepID=UPI0032B40309
MALTDYQLGGLLGNGGQGQAWEAEAPDGASVAIKRFFPKVGPESYEEALDRFRREYEITANLSHPNIVPILEAEIDGDAPYYVMPKADGSLRDMIDSNQGGLELDHALSLFRSICEGMAYAHRQERLHRDLKPENILIFSGIPVISDFGLGRRIDSASSTLAKSVAGAGTDYYVAPEQVRSLHDAVKQSDVYSLGVILFEIATPYSFRDAHAMSDECPAPVRAIVYRCLEHAPQDRYADATALLDAVTRAVSRLQQPMPAGSPKARAEGLIARIKSEGTASAGDLSESLLEIFEHNSSDLELHRSTFPEFPIVAIRELKQTGLERRFFAVLRHYDEELASRNSSFEYADSIALLYSNCASIFDSFGIRRLMLKRTLAQAVDCHRFYARKIFFEMVSQSWIDASYEEYLLEAVQDLTEDGLAFLKETASRFSLPQGLADELI